jgi:hypothetical protein
VSGIPRRESDYITFFNVTTVLNVRKKYYMRNTLKYKWYCLLVPEAVQFRNEVMPSPSALKMEAESCFEELVTVTKLHFLISQRTAMFIVTLMRASGPKQ